MNLHDGLLLLGAMVVLYLYDSALLLYHNEIVLIGGGRGNRISAGSGFELGGRHVFLPSPWSPHRSLCRLSWPRDGVPAEEVRHVRMHRVHVALARIGPWMLMLLVMFVVALPYALFASGTAEALLAWLVCVYVVIVFALLHVYRHRKALNLSGRAFAGVALDALLCAPFALNMVRKIGLRQHFKADLRVVADTALSPLAREQLTAILQQRIHTSLSFAEPGDAIYGALGIYLDHFERKGA